MERDGAAGVDASYHQLSGYGEVAHGKQISGAKERIAACMQGAAALLWAMPVAKNRKGNPGMGGARNVSEQPGKNPESCCIFLELRICQGKKGVCGVIDGQCRESSGEKLLEALGACNDINTGFGVCPKGSL